MMTDAEVERLMKAAESYVALSRQRGGDLRPEAADAIRNELAAMRARLTPAPSLEPPSLESRAIEWIVRWKRSFGEDATTESVKEMLR